MYIFTTVTFQQTSQNEQVTWESNLLWNMRPQFLFNLNKTWFILIEKINTKIIWINRDLCITQILVYTYGVLGDRMRPFKQHVLHVIGSNYQGNQHRPFNWDIGPVPVRISRKAKITCVNSVLYKYFYEFRSSFYIDFMIYLYFNLWY